MVEHGNALAIGIHLILCILCWRSSRRMHVVMHESWFVSALGMFLRININAHVWKRAISIGPTKSELPHLLSIYIQRICIHLNRLTFKFSDWFLFKIMILKRRQCGHIIFSFLVIIETAVIHLIVFKLFLNLVFHID